MKNEERKRKIKKWSLILGSILAVLILGFSGFKILATSYLTQVKVDSQNLSCTTTEEVNNYLVNLKINYFSFKKESLEQKLKEKFFCIGSINTEISFPDKLTIKAEGRKPVFVISEIEAEMDINPVVRLPDDPISASESTREAVPAKLVEQMLKIVNQASASGMFLVDEEGVIFSESYDNLNFPKLTLLSHNLKVGEKIPNDLIKKSQEVYLKLIEIETTSDNLIVVGDRLIVDSKPRIIFSLKEPLDRQIASLQLILAQAKMNSDPDSRDTKSVDSIDLRFDKPVVVYSTKKR